MTCEGAVDALETCESPIAPELATAAPPVSAAPATFRAGIFASLASVAVALLLA